MNAGGNKDEALGTDTSRSTLRFVQAPKSVERMLTVMLTGLPVRIFMNKFRRALAKMTAQDKSTRDDWNSGCDRVRLWQAFVKLVSPETET